MPTIIFKPTESCNSNCVYCDVVARKQPKTMSLELLELIFRKINDYLVEKPDEKITLIWHGGEPLLLGVDYFNKAIEFQAKYCETTACRLEHALQSNLTLMKEEYIDVFNRLGISQVGTSYEPLANIRGGGEERNSGLYNRLFFRGINILEKHGIGWGFIYVVNRRTIERPLDVFYHLTNLRLSGGFMLNPVLIYENEQTDIGITPMEYVDFLGTIFQLWWKNRSRYPDIDPFKSLIRNIVKKENALGCVDSGRCAFSHLYIGPEGETSQCGRAGDWQIIDYGNITERSLTEVMEDPQRQQFNERTDWLENNECADCRFWNICHGGCPLDAYNEHHNFKHKTSWCVAKKVFIEKYFEPITGIKF